MMKMFFQFMLICSLSLLSAPFVGPTVAGPSGMIAVPSARLAWEGASKAAVDLGTHMLNEKDSSMAHKIMFNVMDKFEFGATYHDQESEDSDDLIVHGKFRFYPQRGRKGQALSVGVIHHQISDESHPDDTFSATQLYLNTTFLTKFFQSTAEITLLIGKTFGDKEYVTEDNIDFSFGIEGSLLRSLLKDRVHWMVDFANNPAIYTAPQSNVSRGVFNFGVRTAILKQSRSMKLDLDLFSLDSLDKNREFAMGLVFGKTF